MQDIDALRGLLFDQLQALRSAKEPAAEIERAHAVAGLAQVMINSAKVEVDFLKATGGKNGTGFIPDRMPQIAGKSYFEPAEDTTRRIP